MKELRRKQISFYTKWIGLSLIFLLPLLSIPGFAKIYLKLQDIAGESSDDGRKDWIEVTSGEFGVARPVDGSGNTGSPSFSDISLSKVGSKSSSILFYNAIAGNVIPRGEIEFTMTSSTAELVTLRIELENVLVSSFSTALVPGSEISESFSLNFRKIFYEPYVFDGKTTVKQPGKGWDISKGGGVEWGGF